MAAVSFSDPKKVEAVAMGLKVATKDNVNAVDQLGQTALMIATNDGNQKMVRRLIAAKANVDAQNPSGDTAFTQLLGEVAPAYAPNDCTRVETIRRITNFLVPIAIDLLEANADIGPTMQRINGLIEYGQPFKPFVGPDNMALTLNAFERGFLEHKTAMLKVLLEGLGEEPVLPFPIHGGHDLLFKIIADYAMYNKSIESPSRE